MWDFPGVIARLPVEEALLRQKPLQFSIRLYVRVRWHPVPIYATSDGCPIDAQDQAQPQHVCERAIRLADGTVLSLFGSTALSTGFTAVAEGVGVKASRARRFHGAFRSAIAPYGPS
jgi:hypothetical protein